MNILKRILRALNNAAVFITLESIVRTKSGNDLPLHAYDWAFRDNIVRFLSEFSRVYIISNQDFAETIGEGNVENIAQRVVNIVAEHTKSRVEYMSCRPTTLNNPMRMPDTGMPDYFLNRDGIRACDAVFVWHDDASRECAARMGSIYYNVRVVSKFPEETLL